MDETLIMTLTALAEACEGRLELHTRGIAAVTTDDNLELTIEMEDGRHLACHEIDDHTMHEAILDWREQHHAFFQRVIGAMM